MSRRTSTTGVDRAAVVEVLRAGIGVAHLLGARRALGRPAVLGRVLGVRQLAQATITGRAGTPEAHTLGAVVDAVHGLTMVPLALFDRQSRRFAVRQVWIATLLTVLEVALVGTGRRR
ncbi:hypothetical protein DEJ16_06660 [Curtobacterium sp. MCJR17_055]|uniref:hypothetical protein n=1 Tax=unclassified Curtobacterium TaxID=257496 RepID=UPI000D9862B2|nr:MULTISPECIES: hypothetical protein [unclassified Curtobacterium]PYY37995.1 hypothetical protein DEI87_02415 [Curtobacterium sp. MCBD17_029]PYY57021.1 hypothetical protein DEJ16_06660 [Curtobacterium sp. MCJR17_055]PYY62063.1 hypothetical protein DEJ26_00865 [Curtobacterium sp. MCPF17_015]WIB36158.1 hypothetical protein DEJ15_02715 [Curtobacterium sp. MCJR17_043]